MKQAMFFLLFICFSTSLRAELNISCEVSEESCNSYLCMEDDNNCGKRGYYIGFGYKYCTKFSKYINKFSLTGQFWLFDAKVCLQKATLEVSRKGLSCRQVKKASFKSHVPCYIDAGFCDLPLKDKFQVMKVIYKTILKPSTFLPGFKVMKQCYLSGLKNSTAEYVFNE